MPNTTNTTAVLPSPVITGVGEVTPFDIALYPEGGVTQSLSPTVMGTSVPGSRVQVFDNGALLGEVTAGNDWLWQYTIPRQPPTSDHVFTATATSADGTASADTPYSFTLHIVAPVDVSPPELLVPVITGLVDHVNPVAGLVVDGGVTVDRSPTLQGTSVPGTQVQIFDHGTLIGEVTTADDWSWNYTLPSEGSLGEHVFSVIASSADGTSSSAAPYTQTVHILVPVDIPPALLMLPVITGVIDDVGESTGAVADGGTTDDQTPTLQGTSMPGTQVQIFDNGAPIGQVTTADDWSWQFTLPTQDPTGDHIFSVVASTSDGYRAAAAPYSQSLHIAAPVEVSPALPVPVITAVIDDSMPMIGPVADGGFVSDRTPTIVGTSAPGTVVTVFDNGVNVGDVITGNDWTWRLTLPTIPLVPFEQHTVTVSASLADGTGTTEGVYPFHFDYALILYGASSAPAPADAAALPTGLDAGPTLDQLLAQAGLPDTSGATATVASSTATGGADAVLTSHVTAQSLPFTLATSPQAELLH